MARKIASSSTIDRFDLPPGTRLTRKYEVLTKLGGGWEGEVYKIIEIRTGIERAAKLFYPHRNPKSKASTRYAKKLHKLRHCPILIQYHTEETILYRRTPVTALISEYVEGEILTDFLLRFPGRRMRPFVGLHLLHALACGIEQVHLLNEYHGDLHADNVIVRRFGLGFDLKVLDLFHWATPKTENRQDDICDLLRIFYDALGGARTYAGHPPAIKEILGGMRRSLILKRFRTVSQLRKHLETMRW
ncbi:MAG: protein kinase [Candidatus Eisenbacteria bacterium]|nr:protein kinase [Candidatus Latescibacterota bacterium]MBD3302185.1 protein kinase [Candidatus Eisenbacteria bacterium]